MDIITITKRLLIAKIENKDKDLLFQLTGDQQVMTYFPKVLNYTETKQMVEKILAQYDKYGYCYWKLFTKDGKFIGIAGLLHHEIDGKVETEISYRIKPQFWNNGFATEAAQACKEYAENALNKNRLISIIHPQNIASKCVAQKLGAEKENVITFLGSEHEVYVY